jgi:hypothetical protein
VTENARTRPSCGDRFGRLRVLRTAGNGRRAVCFCVCQRTVTAEIDDLISGAVASCEDCAPLLPERRKAPRDEKRTPT